MEEDGNNFQMEGQGPSSLRRAFTMRSSAARQVAVNFMPSRQPHSTLRRRRLTTEHDAALEEAVSQAPAAADTEERRAELIVREMEQRHQLMEDDPEAEELRREALRGLPQGLTMKRNVRAKLSASVSLRSRRKPISVFKRLKYRISFAWKRGKDRFRDFIFSIELWYEAIRNIEGNFGSAVGSYFYFLRWLFACDLILLIFVLCFLCVPQILMEAGRNETRTDWGFLNFVTGKGAYEDSLLFYGHYQSGHVASGTNSALSYYMPLAYLLTMCCLYVSVLAVLCFRTSYSYRKNFIETAGGLSHVFADKVFCGWDFDIVSPQAAALTANSIYYELKELLNEQNKNKVTTTFWVKFGQYLANAVVTLFVLSLIVGLEYGLWQLLLVEDVKIWSALVTLLVTFVLVIAPALLGLVVRLEFYTPRTALYVTLARTWLLDVGTLTLLLYYWTQSGADCWETSFGQEAYRLVLYDSLISLIVLPLFEFVRGLIYKQNSKSSEAPEFNIAYNSLTLIYNQAVLWFGMLFSPLLVAAVTIKFLLLFYVKRECALRACQPARKIWRAAQTQTVLYMLVTLSLFTTLLAFGSLFLKMSSKVCGPFREYEYVYEVISEGVLRLSSNKRALDVILFVTRPGVIAFVMLLLCVAVYYMRAKALAQRSMVGILRHMLVLQAKDKEFLLAAISKVSNGEWLYSPKPEEGPDSHTWKYLNEVRKPSNAGFHFDVSRLSHAHSLADRPTSFVKDNRNSQYTEKKDDGDTDSSFSWQGSTHNLNRAADTERGREWL